MWSVTAADGFRVPLTLLILVLDVFHIAGNFLLLGSRPGGGERLSTGREGLRKHTVNLISPAPVVLDNLVDHVRHGAPSSFAGLNLSQLARELSRKYKVRTGISRTR